MLLMPTARVAGPTLYFRFLYCSFDIQQILTKFDFQVFLRQKDKAAGLSAEVKVAKMSLIDLAGSEKGGVTGNKGARYDTLVM